MVFSKSTPSDAQSTYSVSSMATTLKGVEAPSKKWFSSSKSKSLSPTDQTTDPKSSSSKDKALHNEAIATYLAFR